jgi:hypothetical protein
VKVATATTTAMSHARAWLTVTGTRVGASRAASSNEPS